MPRSQNLQHPSKWLTSREMRVARAPIRASSVAFWLLHCGRTHRAPTNDPPPTNDSRSMTLRSMTLQGNDEDRDIIHRAPCRRQIAEGACGT